MRFLFSLQNLLRPTLFLIRIIELCFCLFLIKINEMDLLKSFWFACDAVCDKVAAYLGCFFCFFNFCFDQNVLRLKSWCKNASNKMCDWLDLTFFAYVRFPSNFNRNIECFSFHNDNAMNKVNLKRHFCGRMEKN